MKTNVLDRALNYTNKLKNNPLNSPSRLYEDFGPQAINRSAMRNLVAAKEVFADIDKKFGIGDIALHFQDKVATKVLGGKAVQKMDTYIEKALNLTRRGK